jgi:hypothetical protein
MTDDADEFPSATFNVKPDDDLLTERLAEVPELEQLFARPPPDFERHLHQCHLTRLPPRV